MESEYKACNGETLQRACPVGDFVKFSEGRWWEVENLKAHK
jgi:hypothetical protein